MGERTSLYKCSDHATNLNNMKLKDKWCDVTIEVDGKNFCAHKVVLAANLKYFENMLSSESFQESKETVIRMQSVEDADVMEKIIAYAYTGEFLITESTALQSLKLADYLCEDGIKNACIAFLENHVRSEEAVSIYAFARAIGCGSLKEAAKKKIMMDFRLCTETSDYLELNYESMADVLSDGKAQSADAQSELFHGVLQWVIHDVQHRRSQMKDLLSFIDVAQFSFESLVPYLFRNVEDCSDKEGIFYDVMQYCNANKVEQKEREKVLVVVGNDEGYLDVWLYNFIKRTWSNVEQMPHVDGEFRSQAVVLLDKLYYLIINEEREEEGTIFQVLDLTTKSCTTLNSSIKFENDAALCTNDNFIFLCGGETHAISRSGGLTCSITDQVLRYDVNKNLISALQPMRMKRGMAAAVFYQGCLLVIGGCDESSEKLDLVEKYDPELNTWTDFPSLREARKIHAVAILEGKLYVCGGHRTATVEVYDPETNSWQFVASMNKPRWRFLVVAHEGKLLAMGQDGKLTAEVYDPTKDEWHFDEDLSRGLGDLELQGGLVSASCVTD